MINYQQAAEELLARRQAGTKAPRLDVEMRPQSLEDALLIHSEMAALQPVAGWKCLLPPAEDRIIAAPIFNVQQDSDTVVLFEDKEVARVEPEICFVLGKDLPAQQEDYTDAEIIAAIGSAHMALELMQSRFADDAEQSFYESLADGMLNQGMYIGPAIERETAMALSRVAIKVQSANEVRELDGKHPNPQAVDGLLWLINYMSKRGVSFNAGTAIITGSFKGIVNMPFDQETVISYQGLGSYSVTFKRQ